MAAPSDTGGIYPNAPAASPYYETSPPPEAPPEAPPRPRGISKGAIAGIAIVVAVVVVLAALFVGGVGPFQRSSPSNGSGSVSEAQTYTQARASANQSASSYGSGPWSVLLASGLDLPSPVLESTDVPSDLFTSGGISGCVGTSETSETAVTFLGFTGSLSSGQAPDWLFILIGPSGTTLVTVVIGGQSSVWEEYSGSGCSLLALVGSLPGSIVDSSTAVSAALSDGGSAEGDAFVTAHPGGYLTVSAVVTGAWYVDYTTCPVGGNASAGTTYYEYNASVSFSTGKIVSGPAKGTTSCSGLDLTGGLSNLGSGSGSSGIPLDTVFAINSTATLGTGGNFNVNITEAPAGMTMSDLEVSVDDPTNTTVTSDPFAVELYSTTGCGLVLAAFNDPYYGPPLTGACTSGPTGGDAPILVGETFSILTLKSGYGVGDTFYVFGEGSYSGSVTATLG